MREGNVEETHSYEKRMGRRHRRAREREQKHINKTARRGAHFLKAIDGTATRKKSRKSLFHGE